MDGGIPCFLLPDKTQDGLDVKCPPYRLIYLIIWSLVGSTALEGPGPLKGWSLLGRLGSLRVVLEVL